MRIMNGKKSIVLVALVTIWKIKVNGASQCVTRESESNVFLYGFLIESSKVDTLSACTSKCKQNKVCASINMNLMKSRCDLNYSTKKRHPKNMARQSSMIYMEVRDALGSTPRNPMPSCKWFKNLDNQVKSDVYWMKFNEPSSVAFQVFCDMTTDGGGWTLVYSYTFTQYNDFGSRSNAVTPVPNWSMDRSSGTEVPQSTSTPLSESSRSAMDFALWKKIGNEFLVKPNITNWVACVEGSGSLVNWVEGSVTCRVVKAITPNCTTVFPNYFLPSGCGAAFDRKPGRRYIHLDGRTDACLPIHDTCGATDPASHLANVANPGGAIYIR